ncbi:hypothetical protein [Luteibacter sp. 329MFSha]|uniref:hypothetical protein n=1 Tax=Luteibacter sp. 329MFSha TaxID=1798239 RepID=UPI0008BE8FE5|nr:hypothetical protein [Luteibacter sp. 329MFSha]SEV83059.1 hypothetical protein SAMN04515660_0031 [Luteibacter sp. 329MFSha]
MPPVQLALPAALMIGAAIAATTTPPRTDVRELASTLRLSGEGNAGMSGLIDGRPALRMLQVSIRPGASLPWRHGDAGYVVSGELRVQAPTGDLQVIRPGDSIQPAAGSPHHGVAGPAGATVMIVQDEGAS